MRFSDATLLRMVRAATLGRLIVMTMATACGSWARSPEPPLRSEAVLTPTEASPLAAAAPPFELKSATVAWAAALGPIAVENANTGARANIRLYYDDGTIDPIALADFDRVLQTDEDSAPLDHRVLKLAVRAAYRTGAHEMVVVSAYRPAKRGNNGKHATAEALDFKLRGIEARKLASHLRAYPRVGVGIYTHPRTQYVHLDVREQSFHWLDASPPGRTWREAPLPDPHRAERDATYTEQSDLPL